MLSQAPTRCGPVDVGLGPRRGVGEQSLSRKEHDYRVLASRSQLRVRLRAPKATKRRVSVGKQLSRRTREQSCWRSWSVLLWRVFGVTGFVCPK